MNFDPYSRPKIETKIEIIYLLDILFLLLILFIVYSMNAKPYQAINLDLNQSKLALQNSKRSVMVDLLYPSIFINQVQCKQELYLCLQELNIKRSSHLLIRASKETPLQFFIKAFDSLKENHYQNIQLEVEKF